MFGWTFIYHRSSGKCFFLQWIFFRMYEERYCHSLAIESGPRYIYSIQLSSCQQPVDNIKTTGTFGSRQAETTLCSSRNGSIIQSTYSQGHSTEKALYKILDDIIVATDSGRITAFVSLDISAAFDVVDHAVLIQRLEDEFGVTGSCKNWIMSYLTGRSATVHIGSSSSPTVRLMLLKACTKDRFFFCYCTRSSIGRLIHNLGVSCHQYADDTQVYTRFEVPVIS